MPEQYRLNKAIDMMGKMVTSGALKKGLASAVVLVGETGVGKSTAIREWCEENDYGYCSVWLNCMEDNGDLLGRTYEAKILDDKGNPVLDEDGQEQVETRFAVPEFFPVEGRCKERGILVVEEINSVPTHLIEQLKSFISEQRIGEWHLPSGWSIVGTSNPTPEDNNFGSANEYNTYSHDSAIRARMIEIPVKTTMDDWTEYLFSKGDELNPSLGLFLYTKKEAGEEADMFKPEIASPRQFSTLNAVMNAMPFMSTEEVAMIADGVIKVPEFTEALVDFLDTADQRAPFTMKDVLRDPKGCLAIYKEEVENNNQAFIYCTWQNMSLAMKNAGEVKLGEKKYALAHEDGEKMFKAYQKFARVTPRDLLLQGLMTAMMNIAYSSTFNREDNELYEELADVRREIYAEFEKSRG